MKTIERRLEKLEAAAGVNVEEQTIEIWLIEPGTMRAELFKTVVMGRPEKCRDHEPGERVGVCVPSTVGVGWMIEEAAA